ncbi:hypothetical protein K8I61_01430 [bacterium]|nr:hypothetical protein [bacterium]
MKIGGLRGEILRFAQDDKIAIAAVLLLMLLCAVACKPGEPALSPEQTAANAALAEFWTAVQKVDDPRGIDALTGADDDPVRAKEYVEAHETLRGLIVPAERKNEVVAAFLAAQATSVRPLTHETGTDGMTVTAALGPTDAKTGRFSLKQVEGAWKIVAFEAP